MSSRTTILVLAAAAVLFSAAVAVGVYLATEPDAVRFRGGPAERALGPDPITVATTASPEAALPVLAGPAAAPPPGWREAHPTVPAPVPNATPPIAGPPPPGLPADPAEREDALLELRRRRYAEQMERLNRRNVERGGVPADAGARPPSQQPRPGDRRATLTSGR